MQQERDEYKNGRLTAKPQTSGFEQKPRTGVLPLGFRKTRDSFIYIPSSYNPQASSPIAVMLHGAGGMAEHGLALLRKYAEQHRLILLAPASRSYTWDIIADDAFGADVILLDSALQLLLRKYNVDRSRIAIGGFSDGASYALSIGLINGDLFTHVIAFSPGFVYTQSTKGKPKIFISHGKNDRVLPIDRCSRKIVPQLKEKHLTVTYEEFEGEHEIPDTISDAAIRWFLEK